MYFWYFIHTLQLHRYLKLHFSRYLHSQNRSSDAVNTTFESLISAHYIYSYEVD